jgi:hypothetical protein
VLDARAAPLSLLFKIRVHLDNIQGLLYQFSRVPLERLKLMSEISEELFIAYTRAQA